MQSPRELARFVATQLEQEIQDLPENFHRSFHYVRTKNNFCHAVTLSLVGNVLRRLPAAKFIGYDVRLNLGGGIKFQPDVVAFDKNLAPLAFADFESPNSSDARVIRKDVGAYRLWAEASKCKTSTPPYLVITCLPKTRVTAADWELRWTSPGYHNAVHLPNKAAIFQNPLGYWKKVWAQELNAESNARSIDRKIQFLNIDRKTVRVITLSK